MFDAAPPYGSPPEVIARFDELFERRYPTRTTESSALLDRIGASWRAQNRAAASALAAIGELFGYRLARCSDTEEWAVDTEVALSAEVAAALRISQGLAASQLRYARAMRERLPKLAEVFQAGDIDQRTFATIVYRTDLITDRDVLATVDGQLALTVVRWPSMTRGRLAGQIDKIVAKADADAVRRRTERRTEREIWFADLEGGLSEIHGSLLSPDAHALDKRLNTLAGTVCEHDPRTRDQRRADALAALTAGADRLRCRCGLRDCTAGKRPAATPVVIHVIAEQTMIDSCSGTTASEVCADGLVSPELIAELAAEANLECYCRTHHLVKTFWGWRDQQLPDGTIILNSPSGKTYVTTPGSALLFPSLCVPTGDVRALEADPPNEYCGDRNAMMPRRRRTRHQDRARRVSTERRRNHLARTIRRSESMSYLGPAPPDADADPPPF